MRGVVAVLSVGLCGVLALTAFVDPFATAAAVAVAQLVLASSVFQGPVVPAPRTAWLVVAAGGVAATGITAWPDLLAGFDGSEAGESARMGGGTLMGVGPAAALVVLGAMLREMVRRGRRTALTASVAATVTLGVLGTLLAAWVAAAKTDEGDQVVLIAVGAVAVSVLVLSLPGPRYLVAPLAVLAGTGTAAAAQVLVDGPLDLGVAAALGAAGALLAVCGRAIAATLVRDAGRRLAVDAVLPLVFVAPVAFWAAQLFT
jgi:hypothetical protein